MRVKILLVDDERISREVAAQLIKSGGHEVIKAALPSEAIELYLEYRDQIDGVILDMLMPEMNGTELFGRLKEIDPQVKAILLSGYGLNSDIKQALKEGVRLCLQKPVSRADLLASITEHFGS